MSEVSEMVAETSAASTNVAGELATLDDRASDLTARASQLADASLSLINYAHEMTELCHQFKV